MALMLEAGTTTILPNPQLSDVEKGLNTITLRRTMTGARITYVKRRTRRSFVWTFQLTLEKAFELRAFLKEYGTQQIIVTDHNDVRYRGYIKSNPAEFTHSSYTPCHLEMVDVVLEFEGTTL